MTDRELMQQALEALKFLSCGDEVDEELIKALHERLSQPEQEHAIDCPRCGHCCPQSIDSGS